MMFLFIKFDLLLLLKIRLPLPFLIIEKGNVYEKNLYKWVDNGKGVKYNLFVVQVFRV